MTADEFRQLALSLPEAVEALRAVRRGQTNGEIVLVHTGDPLNLVGILTPGQRVSPFSNQVIAYRDGIPVEVGPLGTVRSRLQLEDLGKQTASGMSFRVTHAPISRGATGE